MKGKQILFFATASDIATLIEELEASYSVKYYEMGLFDFEPDKSYDSAFEVSNIGHSRSGDWNSDLRLMMVPKGSSLIVREVFQKKGGIKYAVDPLENQTSICFQFGGVYKDGILIGGSCSTLFISDFSLDIFNFFSSRLKKEFKKIGAFYVGRMAEERLKEGWRLVTDAKSPKEYDLGLN